MSKKTNRYGTAFTAVSVLSPISNKKYGAHPTSTGRISRLQPLSIWLVLVIAVGIYLSFSNVDRASSPDVLSMQNSSTAPTDAFSAATIASNTPPMQRDCSTPEHFQTAIHNGIPHPFVDQQNVAHRLNGVNVRSLIHADGRPRYSQSQMNEIAAKGFDSLRIALNWPDIEPTSGHFNQAALNGLDQAIERAGNAGLWVILDPIHSKGGEKIHEWNIPNWAWGHQPAEDRMLEVISTGALPYLRQITARYCDNQTVIAIDLINEPREPQVGQIFYRNQLLIELYAAWIADLRAIDPNKIFVIEPFYGSTRIDITDNALRPLRGTENVVWSLHDHYAGEGSPNNGYSHSGYPNIQPRTDQWDSANSYPQTDRATARVDIAEHIRAHYTAATEVELPLYIGEYGVPKGWTGGWELLCDKSTIYAELELAAAAWVWNQDVDAGFGLWHPRRGWSPRADAIFAPECQ